MADTNLSYSYGYGTVLFNNQILPSCGCLLLQFLLFQKYECNSHLGRWHLNHKGAGWMGLIGSVWQSIQILICIVLLPEFLTLLAFWQCPHTIGDSHFIMSQFHQTLGLMQEQICSESTHTSDLRERGAFTNFLFFKNVLFYFVWTMDREDDGPAKNVMRCWLNESNQWLSVLTYLNYNIILN